MRKLFLLVGTPAVGKTYFINKHNLEKYTISSDALRDIVSTPNMVVNENGHLNEYGIDYKDEHLVWNMLDQALENRMIQGETTIVDSTHLFKGAFKRYNELRIKYGYEVYAVNMMSQYGKNPDKSIILKDIKNNDSMRERRVQSDVLERYVDRYLKLNKNGSLDTPDWIKNVNKEDFFDVITGNEPLDFNKFDRIQIIGDIHGDYSALQKVFDSHKRGTAYVFVGDYLDRGYKNVETFKFLNSLGGDNLFFLKGNHEHHWLDWLVKHKARGQFGKVTLSELLSDYKNESKFNKDLKKLYKQLLPYLSFTFNGQNYLVSHAGVDSTISPWFEEPTEENINLLDEEVFTMGISGTNGNPYQRNIDKLVSENFDYDSVIQFHGHRNRFNVPLKDNESINNLTQDGEFRWVTLTKDGQEAHVIKSIDGRTFVDSVFEDDDIKSVEQGEGIYAHNFAREVFNNGRWTPTTIQARGLFTRGRDIIGRGFTKFFNVGENDEATLESLQFPVKATKKYNGFLAIAFYDKELKKVQVFSKGGRNPYVKNGKVVKQSYASIAIDDMKETGLYDYLGLYYRYPEYQNTSVLIEVCDPKKDPHIIKYDNVQTKVLEVLNNTKNEEINIYGETIMGCFDNYEFIAHDIHELRSKINNYFNIQPLTEGLVLTGKNKRLKIKSDFYLKAKELRGFMEPRKKNKDYMPDNKRHWYHGAEPWAEYVIEKGIYQFTPDLALELNDKFNLKNADVDMNFSGLREDGYYSNENRHGIEFIKIKED